MRENLISDDIFKEICSFLTTTNLSESTNRRDNKKIDSSCEYCDIITVSDNNKYKHKHRMAAPACGQIVDEFESSFQACLAPLTNPDYFNVRDSEGIKTGVEQTVQRFLDVAKQMECFFLQKRLLLSVQKPEHIILENISELKNELIRKDQLLNKYNEKIQTWQNLLQDVPGTPRPPPPAVPPQPPQNMQAMQGPPPQMPPQVVQQGGAPSHPHHMMQPHIGPTMTSSPAPMQGGMVMQSPQMHPQQHMAAAQQPGGLQGPLAFLERTMSNIGMPDPGR